MAEWPNERRKLRQTRGKCQKQDPKEPVIYSLDPTDDPQSPSGRTGAVRPSSRDSARFHAGTKLSFDKDRGESASGISWTSSSPNHQRFTEDAQLLMHAHSRALAHFLSSTNRTFFSPSRRASFVSTDLKDMGIFFCLRFCDFSRSLNTAVDSRWRTDAPEDSRYFRVPRLCTFTRNDSRRLHDCGRRMKDTAKGIRGIRVFSRFFEGPFARRMWR